MSEDAYGQKILEFLLENPQDNGCIQIVFPARAASADFFAPGQTRRPPPTRLEPWPSTSIETANDGKERYLPSGIYLHPNGLGLAGRAGIESARDWAGKLRASERWASVIL
jgi:hypothetical protein